MEHETVDDLLFTINTMYNVEEVDEDIPKHKEAREVLGGVITILKENPDNEIA